MRQLKPFKKNITKLYNPWAKIHDSYLRQLVNLHFSNLDYKTGNDEKL